MIVQNIPVYDGTLIHSRFAYRYLRKAVNPTGDIIAFRAPMSVGGAGMIDLEDVLDEDFIHSDDAINLCWEIPGLDPFGAVAFQRYFNVNLAFDLMQYVKQGGIEVKGDDILVRLNNGYTNRGETFQYGKLSVSITYSKDGVAIGHTGINIRAGDKAPPFAYSLNITDEEVNKIMEIATQRFYNMTRDIYIATTKVIV